MVRRKFIAPGAGDELSGLHVSAPGGIIGSKNTTFPESISRLYLQQNRTAEQEHIQSLIPVSI